MMKDVVVMSACLAGEKCRYDGSDCRDDDLLGELKEYQVITICPEQLGGLPTPRTPAEIEHGNGFDVLNKSTKVVDSKGTDVTASFLEGALEGVRLAKESGAKMVYLKEKSPSCGVDFIKVEGELAKGTGVFTAILSSQGFSVQGV